MSRDDPTADDEGASGITRRRLVALGTTGWATVSLAGCSRVLDPSMRDDGDSDGGDTGTTTPTGNTTVTNETTTTGESGEETTETYTGEGCASIRQFAAGMNVGLHVSVFDNDTGDALGADAIERVVVEFLDADFDPLVLNWEGDHEAYTDTSWGGKISTSEDLDPGTYRYEIAVHSGDGDPDTVVDEFTIV